VLIILSDLRLGADMLGYWVVGFCMFVYLCAIRTVLKNGKQYLNFNEARAFAWKTCFWPSWLGVPKLGFVGGFRIKRADEPVKISSKTTREMRGTTDIGEMPVNRKTTGEILVGQTRPADTERPSDFFLLPPDLSTVLDE
jgi:hypothetical protein